MVVDPDVRGRGIGRRLVEEALRIARAEGCYKVQLQSANARSGAHRFYEREGFEASSKGYRLYLEP
jgi:GNAT superfamily N-acetyltransferase